jgi:hypothetical protein
VELTITSLRKAGVYDHAITTWEDKDATKQTWDTFQIHFTKQEKLRLQKLTAASAGYHGANHTVLIPLLHHCIKPPLHTQLAATTIAMMKQYSTVGAMDSFEMQNIPASPATTPVLVYDATLMNRKGGSDKISCGQSGKQRCRDPNAPE